MPLTVALFSMGLIYALGRKRARPLKPNLSRYLITLGFPMVGLSIPLATRDIVTHQTQVHGELSDVIVFALHVVFLFTLVILAVSVSNRVAEVIIAPPWVAPSGLDAQLTRLVCGVLGLVAAMVVVLEGAHRLGFSLTTLLAGAGVSGLAIALAAQDSLRNILGSMMIMLDMPFRVGERVVAKGYDGVVEDIGLRSTKIRLLTGHQAPVPNEELARSEVENVSRRPHLRHSSTIELPWSTPPAKLDRALEILRGFVSNHEGMQPDLPPRVYLKGVSKGVMEIAVMYWYHPPEYWEFMAFGEKAMLEASRQFDREGIEFAPPPMVSRSPS